MIYKFRRLELNQQIRGQGPAVCQLAYTGIVPETRLERVTNGVRIRYASQLRHSGILLCPAPVTIWTLLLFRQALIP